MPTLVTANRVNSTNQQGFRNGTLAIDVAGTTTGPPGNIAVARTSDQQIASVSIGQSLTADQVAAMYAADVQYLRAVGAIG